MPKPRELTLPRDSTAARIAALVNDAFEGNLTRAAEAIGCSYDQLYRVCKGHQERGVPLDLAMRVAIHFSVPLEILVGLKGQEVSDAQG